MRHSKQSCHMTWGCSHGSEPSFPHLNFFYIHTYLLWFRVNVTSSWNMKMNPGNWTKNFLQQHLATICIRLVLHLCVELTGPTGPRLVVDHLLVFLDCIYCILPTNSCFVFRRWWKERLFFQLSAEYSGETKMSIFLLCVLVCHYPVWYSSK